MASRARESGKDLAWRTFAVPIKGGVERGRTTLSDRLRNPSRMFIRRRGFWLGSVHRGPPRIICNYSRELASFPQSWRYPLTISALLKESASLDLETAEACSRRSSRKSRPTSGCENDAIRAYRVSYNRSLDNPTRRPKLAVRLRRRPGVAEVLGVKFVPITFEAQGRQWKMAIAGIPGCRHHCDRGVRRQGDPCRELAGKSVSTRGREIHAYRVQRLRSPVGDQRQNWILCAFRLQLGLRIPRLFSMEVWRLLPMGAVLGLFIGGGGRTLSTWIGACATWMSASTCRPRGDWPNARSAKRCECVLFAYLRDYDKTTPLVRFPAASHLTKGFALMAALCRADRTHSTAPSSLAKAPHLGAVHQHTRRPTPPLHRATRLWRSRTRG